MRISRYRNSKLTQCLLMKFMNLEHRRGAVRSYLDKRNETGLQMLRNAIAIVEMEENGGSFGSFGSFDPIPVPPDNNFNSVSRKSIVSLHK